MLLSVHNHQDKARQLMRSLIDEGHKFVFDTPDMLLIDHDGPAYYRRIIEKYDVPTVIYPHGAGVFPAWDGVWEPHHKVKAVLTWGTAQAAAMKEYGYPNPVHPEHGSPRTPEHNPRTPFTPTPEPRSPEPSVNHQEPSESNNAREVAAILCEWASPAAVRSFVAYRRKQKGKALTVTAAKRQAAQLQKILNAGADPDDALGMAEERGWQSVQADWYYNAKGSDNGNGTYNAGGSRAG